MVGPGGWLVRATREDSGTGHNGSEGLDVVRVGGEDDRRVGLSTERGDMSVGDRLAAAAGFEKNLSDALGESFVGRPNADGRLRPMSGQERFDLSCS